MVEIRGLTRKFGDFVAVNNLHLQVSRGTIFGFLGPNGAGKSTTVKMLTGILKPSSGDALIDGSSIQTSPIEIKQKIGVLPEDLALFDALTIWEHLKMCGAIYGLSNQETETRAEQFSTADSTAIAGNDYIATAGPLTFHAGETQKVVAVQINGDTFFEPDETFFVNLTNPVDVTVADAQAVGTIANDDTLKLILDESGPNANQAAALESMLLVRDPFHVLSIAEWLNLGSDRNTRVTIFSNLQLNPGEAASIVTVNLLDSSNQSFDVPAQDVRALLDTPFTQVSFRLPNSLASGLVQVTIKVSSHTSNTGTVRIVP